MIIINGFIEIKNISFFKYTLILNVDTISLYKKFQ